MAKKKTELAEKWTARAPVYRRGISYQPGDDLTAAAQAAPLWAQTLLDAGKVKMEQVQVPVQEEPEPPAEEVTEPEQVEDPDIEHPPD